jgi:hypothetical protein
LLLDPGWVSHVGRHLELFSFAGFVAGLADRFTVIRCGNPRIGTGSMVPLYQLLQGRCAIDQVARG